MGIHYGDESCTGDHDYESLRHFKDYNYCKKNCDTDCKFIKRLFKLSMTQNSNVLTPISTLLKLHEHSTNEKVVIDTILIAIIAVFIMIR